MGDERMTAGPRCPACNTARRAAFRYCLVCGYDFEPRPVIGHEPILQPVIPPPPDASAAAADGADPAAAEREPEHEAPNGSIPGRPLDLAEAAARVRSFVESLEPATRQRLVRLAAEIGVLAALVVVAAVVIVPRVGSTPSAGPADGPTLGITADEAIRTFSLPRLGSYAFTPESSGLGGRIVGKPADGWATLELVGDPTDLSAIVLTVETYSAEDLDPRQRRHVAAFLTIYAPDEIEAMLAAVHTALAASEDQSVMIGTKAVQVRLETVHVGQGAVTVRLVLAPPSQPSPS
jgi:hypothetical protein